MTDGVLRSSLFSTFCLSEFTFFIANKQYPIKAKIIAEHQWREETCLYPSSLCITADEMAR